MIARLFATSARLASLSTMRASWRATATTSSMLRAPMPTSTSQAALMSGGVTSAPGVAAGS